MPGRAPNPLSDRLLTPADADWAYLAGIVDGEGHYAAHNTTHAAPGLIVSMAEPHVVDWCAETFGGRVHRKLWNGRSTYTYRWSLTGLRNVAFATRKLAPHLRLKCDENAAMMAYADTALGRPAYDVPTSRVATDERRRRGQAWQRWRDDCEAARANVRAVRDARKGQA